MKINELEAKLLKKSMQWYLKQYDDPELSEIIKKDTFNKEELEKLKDVVEAYHCRGYVRGEDQHGIMNSLYAKMDKEAQVKVFSTNQKLADKRKKDAEKKRKAAERKSKAAKKKAEREEAKRLKEAEKVAKEAEAKRLASLEPKMTISNIFSDMTEIKPKEE